MISERKACSLKKTIMILAIMNVFLFLYIIIPTIPLIVSRHQEIAFKLSIKDAKILKKTLYKDLETKQSFSPEENERLLDFLSTLSEKLGSN